MLRPGRAPRRNRARIKEVMETDIELKGKTVHVKSIENLSGHSIEPYRIHGGKSVPLVGDRTPDKMVEGEVYAIETFGSTGRGSIREEGECSHYMKNYQSDAVPRIRHPKANQLMGYINRAHSSLAFCRKWLDQNGQTKHMLALKQLVEAEAITEYPPLCDIPAATLHSLSTQSCSARLARRSSHAVTTTEAVPTAPHHPQPHKLTRHTLADITIAYPPPSLQRPNLQPPNLQLPSINDLLSFDLVILPKRRAVPIPTFFPFGAVPGRLA